jgi:SAM-dependent methyltransferase
MPTSDLLIPSPCAICGSHTPASVLFEANFDPSHLNAEVFSARRLPDRIHYRMVKCLQCSLVRSDPIARPDLLAQLYQASTFTYSAELESLKSTYGRYIAELGAKGRLLDVGCGNGFVLEVAQAQGFAEVWGVEPSADAIRQAHPDLQGQIKESIFREGLFEDNFFDVICFFQVLDHLPDPLAVLKSALQALKPGGVILAINHDIEALQARLLGSRSPIVDIEHTYLYSKQTQQRLFEAAGLQVAHSFDVTNQYPLHYWLQLFPLPALLKRPSIALSKAIGLGHLPLALKVGNQGLVARKPA